MTIPADGPPPIFLDRPVVDSLYRIVIDLRVRQQFEGHDCSTARRIEDILSAALDDHKDGGVVSGTNERDTRNTSESFTDSGTSSW